MHPLGTDRQTARDHLRRQQAAARDRASPRRIADLIAGAGVAVASSPGDPDIAAIASELLPHVHPHTVLPDHDHADVAANREAAVNWMILHHLAERARSKADPYEGLDEIYAAGEASWERDFKPHIQDS